MEVLFSGLRRSCCAVLRQESALLSRDGGVRHATKKAGGSSCNGRDSIGRRLGLKKFGGEAVIAGNIIIRQRGKKYHGGANVGMGRDHTLYAMTEGRVRFDFNKATKKQVVSVESEETWLQRCREAWAAGVARREAAAALRLQRIAEGWEKATP